MIKKINLKTKYETKIYGLGEVYEIISIEKLRKKLLKKQLIILEIKTQKFFTLSLMLDGRVMFLKLK